MFAKSGQNLSAPVNNIRAEHEKKNRNAKI